MRPTRRTYDDPRELREVILRLRSSILEAPKEVDAGWEFGRLVLAKGFPQFEECDLPVWIDEPGAAFRKVRFEFPEDNLRGFAAVLSYTRENDPAFTREGDRIYEAFAGWVSPEREQELDEWIAFLNRDIEAGIAAEAARRASHRR